MCASEIGLYGVFFVQKLLCNFKINTHSTGILKKSYSIAVVVWQERQVANVSLLPQN